MSKYEKLLDGAQQHLDSGEQVVEGVTGTCETKKLGQDWVRTGMLLATDRRVVFYAKKLGGYDLESFPYQNVSSVEMSKGMTGHRVRFFASGNDVSMKYINDLPRLQRFVEHVRARMNEPSAPAASGEQGSDIMDQLKKLGELRDAGVLTPEEFEAKKADLLKRL
ncbi:MAG TPA: PH domain-containing protein [Actinomycetota bacterium]